MANVLVAAIALGLFFWFARAGGFSVRDVGQTLATEPVGEITAERPVSQTFTARNNNLHEVDIQFATYIRRNTGTLVFSLLEWPGDRDLVSQTIDLASVEDNAYRSFIFPPIVDSAGRQYRIRLAAPESSPDNAVTVWYHPAATYEAGQTEVAGNPLPGDIAFRASYLYTWSDAVNDLARFGARSGWQLAWGTLLILVPGGLVLVAVGPVQRADSLARIGLASALTFSLLPLLLLWATQVSLGFDQRSTALLVLGSLAGIAAIPIFRWQSHRKVMGGIRVDTGAAVTRVAEAARRRLPDATSWVGISLLMLALWSRLFVARDIPIGMWGDSYHHTIISQLIAERGRVPDSYLPYAPLESFTYHYGFHSLVAFLHWATGIEIALAVVLMGQVLSALSVVGVYFLAVVLTGNRWIALVAGLVAGLLSPMPAYYVNWGRFTQLAGQTILPFAIGLTISAVDRHSRRDGLLATILLGGLLVTHYRVAVFYVAFVGVYLLYELVRSRTQPQLFARKAAAACVIGAAGGLLSAPWLWNQMQHHLVRVVASVRGAPASAERWLEEYNRIGEISIYVPSGLLILAALGLLLGVMQKRRATLLILLWVSALFAIANPERLGLPRTWIINNFAVLIALYLPVGVAAGMAVGLALEALRARLPSTRSALAALAATVILASGLWGAGNGLSVRDERWTLVRESDVRAMAWIREHTPPDAKFLVNGFLAGEDIVVGSDAGWWLPFLSRRENTVPPAVYSTEVWTEPGLGSEVLRICTEVLPAPGAPTALSLLRHYGVTHVYIGSAGGQLKPDDFLQSEAFELIYREDTVYVFRLREGPVSAGHRQRS